MSVDASVRALLANLGRGSTPAVAEGPENLSVFLLAVGHDSVGALHTVASAALTQALAAHARVAPLLPGSAAEAADAGMPVLIVEQKALYSGAWLGTGDFVSGALVEDLYQAQVSIRRRGGIALWVDSIRPEGLAEPRLRSASSGVFQELDIPDPELDGARSGWWMALREYVLAEQGGRA